MRTRAEIKAEFDLENATIAKCEIRKEELLREVAQVNDDMTHFEEKEEEVIERINRKKVKVTKLIGRIHWTERFKDMKDDNTIELLEIYRSRVVKINGEWLSLKGFAKV